MMDFDITLSHYAIMNGKEEHMSRRLIKIISSIIVVFFLILPDLSQARWGVKDIGTGGRYSSIAIDPSGYPHISYFDESSDYVLKHAFFNGSKWNVEVIDGRDLLAAGYYNAIAVDSFGHIHICYFADDYVNNLSSFRYAYFDGTKWNISIIGDGGSDASITVDSNNYPNISYIHGSELRYLRYNGNTWISETVANGTQQCGTSIALSLSGEVHIAFSYAGLFWAKKTVSGNWEINQIDSGGYPSIALDSLGNPHVAYIQGNEEDGVLEYGRHDGTVWQIQTPQNEIGLVLKAPKIDLP